MGSKESDDIAWGIVKGVFLIFVGIPAIIIGVMLGFFLLFFLVTSPSYIIPDSYSFVSLTLSVIILGIIVYFGYGYLFKRRKKK